MNRDDHMYKITLRIIFRLEEEYMTYMLKKLSGFQRKKIEVVSSVIWS